MCKKIIFCILSLVLFSNCADIENQTVNEQIAHDKKIMQLGGYLYTKELRKTNGNMRKADSLFNIDGDTILKNIYKIPEEKEKHCGHVFFNKFCQDCREYRDKY